MSEGYEICAVEGCYHYVDEAGYHVDAAGYHMDVKLCGINGCSIPIDEEGFHVDGSPLHIDDNLIPEDGETGTDPLPVEDNWEIEIMVLARNANDVTQVANIKSENRITIKNIVSDSELLRILNFIQPKP